MNKNEISKQAVLESNRVFYDKIASVYEGVDSRRNSGIDFTWIREINQKIFEELSLTFPQEKLIFVDAGAGNGFLAEKAAEFFKKMLLIDLSQEMLNKISIPGVTKILGDCTKMPIEDNSIHYVGAFATLHHLFDPGDFFRETYRVLQPGGLLYTDHDIEETFVRNFKFPLRVYRYFYDHGPKYIAACPESRLEDYEISEFHGGTGLSGLALVDELKRVGFKRVNAFYHWDGGGTPEKLVNFFGLKKILSRRGFAPNLRILAQK